MLKKRTLCWLAAALVLTGVAASQAANVGVTPGSPWGGWMNVYDLVGGNTQGSYLWGSGWGTADLPAVISGGTLTLGPNTSTWNPSDPYWVNGGQPNKWLEANFYVDAGTSMGGTTVTFSGNTIANTLAAPYSSLAFIKEFTSGYNWIGMTTQPLVGGTPFSITRDIGAGNIAQYGFMTLGPNADPATVGTWGQVVIAVVPEPAAGALLLLGLAGLALRRTSRA